MNALDKINLADLSLTELRDWFAGIGEKPFRATQIIKWIHQQGVTDFAAMTNLSKALRESLPKQAVISFPSIESEQISQDGTIKWLIKLNDDNHVETVFIPEAGRGTLCVSSQVGCPLNCKFCATATLGYTRNLTLSEIIGQMFLAMQQLLAEDFDTPRRISNVVMMGMGEPLLNFDNVVKTMDLLIDDNAYGLSKYRVTLSTAGVVPMLWKLREISNVALAVSLHAPNDELRDKLMPINKQYPLKALMAVCRAYYKDSRRSITFEYAMLKDVNDSAQHAKELINLLRGIRCKVNLIPYNVFPGTDYQCSDVKIIDSFRDLLMTAGINTVTRKTRGSDIAASCGQLVGEKKI